MVSKPLMIAPNLQSQDYSGLVRQSMGAIFPGVEDPAVFAQALQAESAARPASTALGARQISIPGQERDPLAGKELVQANVLEINGKRAMALDVNSLFTLSRIAGNQTRNSQAGKASPVQGFDGSLGSLSARFESGQRGSAAIGYDRNGGTSYGKYQISSRQGTFDSFLDFLDQEAPDLAKSLRAAGPANTGSRSGQVPDVWRAIAAADPQRLEELEEKFIRNSHYEPAAQHVRKLLGQNELSEPLREVIWSTAVQHGPTGARNIFDQAFAGLSQTDKGKLDEAALIENVYAQRSTKFSSSSAAVRESVLSRFRVEKAEALAMLEQPGPQLHQA